MFDVNVRLILLSGLLYFLAPSAVIKTFGANVPNTGSSKDSVTSPSLRMSNAVEAYLAQPLDKNTFAQGLSLIKDPKDSARSRKLTLDKLHGARKTMDSGQLRAFRDEAAALAKNPQEPPELSARAIGVMASANLLLLERGAITPQEAKQEASFLISVARDPGKDREMRGRAIRALSDLEITEAAPVLRQIVTDPAHFNNPEIARNGCIALSRLSPGQAQPLICNVMTQTREQSIFGSGAFALGQLKTPEAMAALVTLQNRFPDSGSCEGALAGMEDVILAQLRNPGSPQLIPAIHATRHLWKKSQREQYVPLLHGLLKTAPPAARAQAVEQLLSTASALDFAAENRELEAVLGLIADQRDLGVYAERIRRRLSAKELTPTGRTIPVPPSAKVH